MSTTSRGISLRHDFKCLSIFFLSLLIVINCAKGTIDYAAFRKHSIPQETPRKNATTIRKILEESIQRNISTNDNLQHGTEHLLQYGALLRMEILEIFGNLVYDNYDDFRINEIEALYKLHSETLKRKYNIFDILPRILNDPDTRPTKICSYINEHVDTCLKESSSICMNIKIHDEPRQDVVSNSAHKITRQIYELTKIPKYYPQGFSPAAILQYLKTGELRFTSIILSGLLENVRYKNFDDRVRRSEREVIYFLTKVPIELTDDMKKLSTNAKTVNELLKNYLTDEKFFNVATSSHANYLSKNLVIEIDAISKNIELLGTVYENSTINLKYLFELILPNDTIDDDVLNARDYLLKMIVDETIVNYLRIEKYQQAGPDQLIMEIFEQLMDINFADDLVISLYTHARYWHKSHMIENVHDFLELFDAYENLRYVPKYQELMKAIDEIKINLEESRNVTVELLCSRPRSCLRIGLEMIRNCSVIDWKMKRAIDKFRDQSCECFCLENDSEISVTSTTEFVKEIHENMRNNSMTLGNDNSSEIVEEMIDSTMGSAIDLTSLSGSTVAINLNEFSEMNQENEIENMTEKSSMKLCEGNCSFGECENTNCSVEFDNCIGNNCSGVGCIGEDCNLQINCSESECNGELHEKDCKGLECKNNERGEKKVRIADCDDENCSEDLDDDCEDSNCFERSCEGEECEDDTSINFVDLVDKKECRGSDCSIINCVGNYCRDNDTEFDCEGPECLNSSCKGLDCENYDVDVIDCEDADCQDDSVVNLSDSSENNECRGFNCSDNCVGKNCRDDGTKFGCEVPDCQDDSAVNLSDNSENNECRGFNCSDNCVGKNCRDDGMKFGCEVPDCQDDSQLIETVTIEQMQCEGPDCSINKTKDNCEGHDCPDKIAEVDCKNSNCSEFGDQLKSGNMSCQGENCTDNICEGANCLNNSIDNCEGQECLKINCEGSECSGEPIEAVCLDSNCILDTSNETCSGSDCSLEPEEETEEETEEESNCNDDNCSNVSSTIENHCEGINCATNSTKNDFTDNKIEDECKDANCKSEEKKICKGIQCFPNISLDSFEKSEKEICNDDECLDANSKIEGNCTDCESKSTQNFNDNEIDENCDEENCKKNVEKLCKGVDCFAEFSDELSEKITKELCNDENCTTSTVLSIEEINETEVTTIPTITASTSLVTTIFRPLNGTIFCGKTDPHYRRQLNRLQKMRRIDAASSTSRSSYGNWSAIFDEILKEKGKTVENLNKNRGENPLLRVLGNFNETLTNVELNDEEVYPENFWVNANDGSANDDEEIQQESVTRNSKELINSWNENASESSEENIVEILNDEGDSYDEEIQQTVKTSSEKWKNSWKEHERESSEAETSVEIINDEENSDDEEIDEEMKQESKKQQKEWEKNQEKNTAKAKIKRLTQKAVSDEKEFENNVKAKSKELQEGWKRIKNEKLTKEKNKTEVLEKNDNEDQSDEEESLEEIISHRGIIKARSGKIQNSRKEPMEWLENRGMRRKLGNIDSWENKKKNSKTKKLYESDRAEPTIVKAERIPLIYRKNTREIDPWMLKHRYRSKTPKRKKNITSRKKKPRGPLRDENEEFEINASVASG